MKLHELIQDMEEGVNDPHIFKAVFMAGGPGSGKSFVAKKMLAGTGLKMLNSDEIYEFLMKKQGLDLDPDTIASDKGQEIRGAAKSKYDKRETWWHDGRLGLAIDGTGKDLQKVKAANEKLKAMGYDTMMLFVNTSLEIAQKRNLERERSLKPELVEELWRQVQDNIMKFQQIFGASNFHVVDNNGGLEDPDRAENFKKVDRNIDKFLNAPVTHRNAKAWIQSQKKPK